MRAVQVGRTVAQATALVHDGHTASAAFERAAVRPGETVLITAAAGGLGTLLIQPARRAGAEVVAVARGETKLALTRGLGAGTAIDYAETGWTERVRAAIGGRGPDVVFDGAGGQPGEAALAIAADNGRFIGYGAAAGEFTATGAESAGPQCRGTGPERPSGPAATSARLHRPDARRGRGGADRGRDRPDLSARRGRPGDTAIEDRSALGRTLLAVR